EAARARLALDGLRARRAGKPTTMGVASILEKTASDDDPSIRQWTAFAANQWQGTPEEEQIIERFLVELANDPGKGGEGLARELANDPERKDAGAVTKVEGYSVRVEARLALARRGSEKATPELFRELLSLEELRKIFVIEQQAVPEKKKSFLFWSWTEAAVPGEKPN